MQLGKNARGILRIYRLHCSVGDVTTRTDTIGGATVPVTTCHKTRVVAQGSNEQKGNTHTSTPTLTVTGDVGSQTT